MSAAIPSQTPSSSTSRESNVSIKKTLFTKHWDLHKKVEASPLVTHIREKTVTKIEYLQYLVNLRHDLSIIEPAIKDIKTADLSYYCLLEKLDQDIEAIPLSERQISPLMDLYKHREHLEHLAKESPYLLVAHSVIQYFGIVFGGQKQRERLKEADLPTNLYQLPDRGEVVRESAFKILDQFDKSLDEAAYHRFVEELKCAWEFAGDILDNNIR